MKKVLSFFLAVLMILSCFTGMNMQAMALESTGNSTFDAFINDSRFTDGVSWGARTPKLSSWSSSGCCAYCADFAQYCYGDGNPNSGEKYYGAWDVRAGDIIYTQGNGNYGYGEHWYVVLKRSGNSLYTAEGNVDNRVYIGWNYTIVDGATIKRNSGGYFPFSRGHHRLAETPSTYSLDADVIVDGTEYMSGYTGFTFDVHINGVTVASNVKDYYNGSVTAGAGWSLVNIKNPSEYVVTGSLDAYGNFAGVLNQDTLVKPNFKKPTLKSTKYYNGSKYEFYSATTSWDSANLFAKGKGGHLVTINSSAENEFVKNNNTVGACWLGGKKQSYVWGDEWSWMNGELFSYTNWKENQPDNNKTTCVSGEKYLMMYDTGKWNDCPCYWSTVTGFIVEYDHTHSYTSKTTTSAYLKSAANCTSPAVYYYKCSCCDEKGTETFTNGSALGHTESAWIVDKEATTTAAGSKHIECTVCHTTIRTATIPKITTTDSKLVIESKKAKAGDEIEVSVSLEKNPGIAGLQISLNYDTSVLTLKNSKNGTLFSGFTAGKNFVWDDSSNITADGKIATFTFTVADNAAAGEYEISAIVRSCTNEAFDDVELAVESGVVTVVDFTYGDANDDDAINMKDVVILRQYLANYDYETNTSTVTIGAGADANSDGAINMKDVVILRQYLANFDYETNTSTVVLGPHN